MKKIIFIVIVAAIGLIACKKDEVENNQQSTPKSVAAKFTIQPYTYLQDKYIDSVLVFELKKQEKNYDPEKFSYEQKLEMILLIDSLKKEGIAAETKEDVYFYESLQIGLMAEINSHPYIQKFAKAFASKDNIDANEMMIYTGDSDCDDAISKFQILQYYEDGIDIYGHYKSRNNLTGNDEWSYYPPEVIVSGKNPNPKGVRYILHLKWRNTIEYMWNGATSTVKTNTVTAMGNWKTAANNKISFSEITKNVGWNKTCWIFGWKYFLRISAVNSGNFSGRSTIGKVPWAAVDFKSTLTDLSTYRHELGHALGLYHEHQRFDRDTYVIYNSNNVQSGQGVQFTKMTAGSYNYYGSTFDFNSIMIYSSWAYSKNGNPTLTKKDGSTWRYPEFISETDKSVIRQMYP